MGVSHFPQCENEGVFECACVSDVCADASVVHQLLNELCSCSRSSR